MYDRETIVGLYNFLKKVSCTVRYLDTPLAITSVKGNIIFYKDFQKPHEWDVVDDFDAFQEIYYHFFCEYDDNKYFVFNLYISDINMTEFLDFAAKLCNIEENSYLKILELINNKLN